jgi:Reverse transcriptase (RNA-dependent DNA polymerase)
MQHEVDSLEEQGVFECTTLPAGWKAIGCHWVYAYKYNPDGSIICGKEKACLVAQGFSQCPEDYGSTYAPVAKTTSIWIVLAHATHHDWEIFSFNVKTAFLHVTIHSHLSEADSGFP